MADIFVSYAQGDREWVKDFAAALEAEGFSVWWDPNLLPGTRFREIIKTELSAAKAVIVVWSRLSVVSDWVLGEADEARTTHRLVPVLRERVKPPTEFRSIHVADLSQWRGRREHPDFRQVVNAVQTLVGRVPRAAPQMAATPAPRAGGLGRRASLSVAALILVAAAAWAGWTFWTNRHDKAAAGPPAPSCAQASDMVTISIDKDENVTLGCDAIASQDELKTRISRIVQANSATRFRVLVDGDLRLEGAGRVVKALLALQSREVIFGVKPRTGGGVPDQKQGDIVATRPFTIVTEYSGDPFAIHIDIDFDGSISWYRGSTPRTVDEKTLSELLQSWAKSTENDITITPNKLAKFEVLVRAIRLVQDAGVTEFSVTFPTP